MTSFFAPFVSIISFLNYLIGHFHFNVPRKTGILPRKKSLARFPSCKAPPHILLLSHFHRNTHLIYFIILPDFHLPIILIRNRLKDFLSIALTFLFHFLWAIAVLNHHMQIYVICLGFYINICLLRIL